MQKHLKVFILVCIHIFFNLVPICTKQSILNAASLCVLHVRKQKSDTCLTQLDGNL